MGAHLREWVSRQADWCRSSPVAYRYTHRKQKSTRRGRTGGYNAEPIARRNFHVSPTCCLCRIVDRRARCRGRLPTHLSPEQDSEGESVPAGRGEGVLSRDAFRSCRCHRRDGVCRHKLFGPWKDTHDPTNHDDIIGLAPEFGQVNPLGYDDAKVGGTFLKIGVGELEKPKEEKYSFATKYKVVKLAE